MNLLMISGDRSAVQGKKGAFYYTLEELCKHFARIDVITPKVKHVHPPALENVYFHPSKRGLWYQPRWIEKKGRELRETVKCDVMTVHEFPPFYNGFGARRLHRKTGIPYALEIHHVTGYPVSATNTEQAGYALSRMFLKRDAKHATCVRVVNDDVYALLKSWGIDEEKLSIVPSFYLDSDVLQAQNKEEKESFDIVCACRMVANKGLPELITAMKDLPHRTLLLIGDGPLRHQAMQLARRLGIADRITFFGWLRTQEDVARAMHMGKIFVMNSKSEGGPRVALEAMALGLPVIATRVGIMPNVIQEGVNGIFTSGTVPDLVEKIATLLQNDEARRRMGENATAIMDRFERKKCIAEYAMFLQSLA